MNPSSTWAERLLMNLFSYSLVLGPVAFVVLTTKYRLCPNILQTSALVQRFVYGNGDGTGTSNRNLRPRDKAADNERLLIDDSGSARNSRKRLDNKQFPSINHFELLWCFLGLQLSYLIWGVLQEKIMTTEYAVTLAQTTNQSLSLQTKSLDMHNLKLTNTGSNYHQTTIRFHDSQFLVLINRIVAFILAIFALVFDRPKKQQSQLHLRKYIYYQGHHQSAKPQAPLYEYVYCSLSNILSSWCQYEALKYVNFPTQVLSKSCKIVPVMLTSKLMLHKAYQITEYLCALLLSIGMFIFLLNQPVTLKSNLHDRHFVQQLASNLNNNLSQTTLSRTTSLKIAESGQHNPSNELSEKVVQGSSLLSGLTILAFYLASDSFTSNWQQNLFTKYEISNWQMMAATNFYSIMLTLTSLYQLGALKPALELLIISRALLLDCILMSAMSSIGQLFVYYTIKRFGSVIFAVIMTLRQFLAILLSCAIYGHQLTLGSSSGLLLVFLVVSFQVWHKSRRRHNAGKSAASTGGDSTNQLETRIQFKTYEMRGEQSELNRTYCRCLSKQ